MEHSSTEELYVVVYHFPFQVVATGRPVVVVYGLVAVDSDKVLTGIGCKFTVEIGSGNDGLLVLGKASGCVLNNGKHLRKDFVEGFLVDVEHFLLDLVDLGKDIGTLIDGCVLDGSLQLLYLLFLLLG